MAPAFLVKAPVSVHKAICHCFTYYQLLSDSRAQNLAHQLGSVSVVWSNILVQSQSFTLTLWSWKKFIFFCFVYSSWLIFFKLPPSAIICCCSSFRYCPIFTSFGANDIQTNPSRCYGLICDFVFKLCLNKVDNCDIKL